MNNIKGLPGCFRGSRQLGQTLVHSNDVIITQLAISNQNTYTGTRFELL